MYISEIYRKLMGVSQVELAKELSEICPGIDNSLISKAESGLCRLPYECEVAMEETMVSHRLKSLNEMDRIEKEVLEAIKEASKEHPLTRQKLKEIVGAKDSHARDYIGRLRDKGYRIVGSAGTKGYYIAESESEYKEFRKEYHAKAMTYLRRIKAMDNFVERQVRMDG